MKQDTRNPVTQKRQVFLAWRGQGRFRERVSMIERACRTTQVNRPEQLIASHCKPWRHCESNDERLDGENGLLLTPTADDLFDRGFHVGSGSRESRQIGQKFRVTKPNSSRIVPDRVGLASNGICT